MQSNKEFLESLVTTSFPTVANDNWLVNNAWSTTLSDDDPFRFDDSTVGRVHRCVSAYHADHVVANIVTQKLDGVWSILMLMHA